MRIAVAGATGHIGALTVSALAGHGHDVVRISRSLGVDCLTGEGLDEALEGVEAVVDATNSTATDRAEAVASFGTITRNLLAAEQRAGVRHHVLLSIVGVDRVEGTRTTRASGSRSVSSPMVRCRGRSCPPPSSTTSPRWSTSWAERDGAATIAPLLVQPIAPADVANVLAEVAAGEPQGRYPDVAGPEPQDLVDMARRTNEVRGHHVRLIPAWSGIVRHVDGGRRAVARRSRPHRADHLRRVAGGRRALAVCDSGCAPADQPSIVVVSERSSTSPAASSASTTTTAAGSIRIVVSKPSLPTSATGSSSSASSPASTRHVATSVAPFQLMATSSW